MFLFINDDAEWLASIRSYFRDNPNVVFAECHKVEEALEAIAKHRPDVIFLDHSLTEGGNEGLEIADRIKGKEVKIYSTTANRSIDIAVEYLQRGIERVGKTDLRKLKSVIAELS